MKERKMADYDHVTTIDHWPYFFFFYLDLERRYLKSLFRPLTLPNPSRRILVSHS